jgi:hypothetical protein
VLDLAAMNVEPYSPLFGMPGVPAESASLIVLERIELREACRLNEEWHSRLPKVAGGLAFGDVRLAYAGVYDGGIYGVAIWTRPVAANRMALPDHHMLELRRLAIPDYSPKFTATRMLGLMARRIRHDTPEVCTLVSYQDTGVHTGTIYKAANWHVGYAQTTHMSWESHTKRKAADQSSSPKVRWELKIKPHCQHDKP